ncbi:radical SAM protein [Carnobacterium gallinarum]|uniref:SPL family radical SAM protein n=1 Tax=Carnobacterium gallinarum TaxID=2749 RepID=UPI0005589D9A|nr:radical SAM protein [Carnobacterium gallinarum]
MDFIPAKTLLTKNKTTNWFGYEYNMNIYRGCHHGCIYCDSRSSCYQVEDFDRVRAKENSTNLLFQNLTSKRQKGIIGTGAMSDPYNHDEKKYKLTRLALEQINQAGFGIGITTKSDLITRDIDLLTAIKQHSPVIAGISITAADDSLAKKIERNVSSSSKRFHALKKLTDAGIYSGVLLMPVLPFITDSKENILSIVHQAFEAGVNFIYPWFGMTLRENQQIHYYQWLDHLFPDIKQKYIQTYHNSYSCPIPNEQELSYLFKNECTKLGITYQMKKIITEYQKDYHMEQINLF